MARRNHLGFTLIELVVVITLLGVLAALALPRFYDVQRDARVTKANSVLASLRTAAATVKATAMSQGKSCASTNDTVVLEGTTIATIYCYPQALANYTGGILAAANLSQSNDGVRFPASGTGSGGAAAGAALTVQMDGAATPANCAATYTAPTASGLAPTFSVDITGC